MTDARCSCGLEKGHDESCSAANELVALRAERDRLRAALSAAHDSAERLARALIDACNPRLRG